MNRDCEEHGRAAAALEAWLSGSVLAPTSRHEALLRPIVREVGHLRTAVIMREPGVTEIMTADADFRRFPFLAVVDPVHDSA